VNIPETPYFISGSYLCWELSLATGREGELLGSIHWKVSRLLHLQRVFSKVFCTVSLTSYQ
jgi:hypothetical protein